MALINRNYEEASAEHSRCLTYLQDRVGDVNKCIYGLTAEEQRAVLMMALAQIEMNHGAIIRALSGK